MTVRNPQVAASPSQRDIAQPAAGRGAVAGEPFGPVLHRQPRIIRPAPASLRERVRLADLAANRQQFQADVGRNVLWTKIAIGVALFTAAYFCGQLIRWAVFL